MSRIEEHITEPKQCSLDSKGLNIASLHYGAMGNVKESLVATPTDNINVILKDKPVFTLSTRAGRQD